MPRMSGLFRILLIGAVLAFIFVLLYQPRQARGFIGKVKTVAFAYVAAILLSALLRVTGIWDWGT